MRRSAALALLLALAGCASLDVGPKGDTTLSAPAAAPRTTGTEQVRGADHQRLVALFGGEYQAPAAKQFLDAVLVRLAPAGDSPEQTYRVTILNSPVVNAFALPTGDLYVTRGLLALANDTSEIGAVMAHEIGHVTARHAAQRAEAEKNAALIGRAATAIQSRQKGEEVTARGRLSLASFSRQQEFEADAIGVRTIAKAGYDPYGASRFLASLARSAILKAAALGQTSGSEAPDLLASHPGTSERIARAITTARQYGAPGLGETGRAAYLAAIDGVQFGDDPADGFVRGQRFVHPKLGFTVTAPDGFALDNSAQAVLGIGNGGLEALRLDSVKVDASTPLETYLASGWIEGLDRSSVEVTTVNGLPAATAIAKDSGWEFRVAVIRLDDSVYRLIYTSHNLQGGTDTRFRASINTFRRLGADEGAAAPLHLKITQAHAGDTPASLAAGMVGVERPLDTFLLINGLEPGVSLKADERYKLVQ